MSHNARVTFGGLAEVSFSAPSGFSSYFVEL